tara:strand:+ start:2310 stop:2930 length:621 start_codon:yes stop_codon:yes gene_type:complete
MATFSIPGNNFNGIGIGAAAPNAGYYAVSITEVEMKSTDKPTTRRVHVQFDNGFTMFTFMNVGFDAQGNAIAGLTENQTKGYLAGIKSILASLGYSETDLANNVVTDEWLLTSTSNRKGFVEFIPGQKGVDGSYNTIKNWLTKGAFDALKASGDTPAQVTNSTALGGLPQNTAATGPVNVTGNGAGAPTITTNLPPAPSLAQGVVS